MMLTTFYRKAVGRCSGERNLFDPNLSEVLSVTLFFPVALPALSFENDDLVTPTVPNHLSLY
tara:strand:- start:21 stop:206 length:186 start_codon:yes stop_codon:yes gene_type:complete